MKFYAVVAALTAAAGASAQSPTVGAGAQPTNQCAAANIVQACVEQLMPNVDACTGNDYKCLCSAWTGIQGCYNNCPSDQQAPAAANSNVGSYCRAYSETASKSTQSSTSSSSSSTSSSSTFSTASASSGSSTGSSSTPTAAAPSGSHSANSGSRPSKTTAAKPTESTTTSTSGAMSLSANGLLAAIGVVAALW